MKKMTMIAMALAMVLTTTACGEGKAPDSTPAEPTLVSVTTPETITELPSATSEATGWTCGCGTVNLGKYCSECGNSKPSNAETSVSEESTESTTPYEELNSELDPEMKAKLEELRANGAETAEVKWGTKSPIPFTEYSAGKRFDISIKCNGTFTYFPEVNGDMDEHTLESKVLMCLQPVVSHRSGYFDAEHLSGESEKMQEEVRAELANEHGILLDSFVINSIMYPQNPQ